MPADRRARSTSGFHSPRVLTVGLLGFVSGLPYLLSGSTLTTWMRTAEVDLETIGFFAWVQLPYTFKPLWAPLLDRFRVPWLGRRRGWMVLWQLGVAGALVVMGTLDPARVPWLLFGAACAVAFCSASLDIVVDAYRTDVLTDDERGPGGGAFVTGYRLALIVAGAGALMLAGIIPWRFVFWTCALVMLATLGITLRAPPIGRSVVPPRTLRDAVVLPLVDFFGRHRAVAILIFVLLYKFGEGLAAHLVHPFLVDLDFSVGQIGALNKGIGIPATIAGTLAGGAMIPRLGPLRSLLYFGILQAAPNLLYSLLAVIGNDPWALAGVVAVDQLCGGLATAALVAYLMWLCDRRFSAFQYAILSSASSLLGRFIGGWSGSLAASIGWAAFFALTAAAVVPSLLALAFVPHPGRDEDADDPPESP